MDQVKAVHRPGRPIVQQPHQEGRDRREWCWLLEPVIGTIHRAAASQVLGAGRTSHGRRNCSRHFLGPVPGPTVSPSQASIRCRDSSIIRYLRRWSEGHRPPRISSSAHASVHTLMSGSNRRPAHKTAPQAESAVLLCARTGRTAICTFDPLNRPGREASLRFASGLRTILAQPLV